MAKKQAIANESVASASSTRAAKPKTPRVKAAQHKVVPIEVVSSEPVFTQGTSENPREIIAQMAYGFWEARGCYHGADIEDWLRAENEYLQRVAASRN